MEDITEPKRMSKEEVDALMIQMKEKSIAREMRFKEVEADKALAEAQNSSVTLKVKRFSSETETSSDSEGTESSRYWLSQGSSDKRTHNKEGNFSRIQERQNNNTVKERSIAAENHEAWKAERAQIDEARNARVRKDTGEYCREWDKDKLNQSDEDINVQFNNRRNTASTRNRGHQQWRHKPGSSRGSFTSCNETGRYQRQNSKPLSDRKLSQNTKWTDQGFVPRKQNSFIQHQTSHNAAQSNTSITIGQNTRYNSRKFTAPNVSHNDGSVSSILVDKQSTGTWSDDEIHNQVFLPDATAHALSGWSDDESPKVIKGNRAIYSNERKKQNILNKLEKPVVTNTYANNKPAAAIATSKHSTGTWSDDDDTASQIHIAEIRSISPSLSCNKNSEIIRENGVNRSSTNVMNSQIYNNVKNPAISNTWSKDTSVSSISMSLQITGTWSDDDTPVKKHTHSGWSNNDPVNQPQMPSGWPVDRSSEIEENKYQKNKVNVSSIKTPNTILETSKPCVSNQNVKVYENINQNENLSSYKTIENTETNSYDIIPSVLNNKFAPVAMYRQSSETYGSNTSKEANKPASKYNSESQIHQLNKYTELYDNRKQKKWTNSTFKANTTQGSRALQDGNTNRCLNNYKKTIINEKSGNNNVKEHFMREKCYVNYKVQKSNPGPQFDESHDQSKYASTSKKEFAAKTSSGATWSDIDDDDYSEPVSRIQQHQSVGVSTYVSCSTVANQMLASPNAKSVCHTLVEQNKAYIEVDDPKCYKFNKECSRNRESQELFPLSNKSNAFSVDQEKYCKPNSNSTNRRIRNKDMHNGSSFIKINANVRYNKDHRFHQNSPWKSSNTDALISKKYSKNFTQHNSPKSKPKPDASHIWSGEETVHDYSAFMAKELEFYTLKPGEKCPYDHSDSEYEDLRKSHNEQLLITFNQNGGQCNSRRSVLNRKDKSYYNNTLSSKHNVYTLSNPCAGTVQNVHGSELNSNLKSDGIVSDSSMNNISTAHHNAKENCSMNKAVYAEPNFAMQNVDKSYSDSKYTSEADDLSDDCKSWTTICSEDNGIE